MNALESVTAVFVSESREISGENLAGVYLHGSAVMGRFNREFSSAHLGWYRKNPSNYIGRMHGTDKDLAAHFMILYHRGKCLYGKEIPDIFEHVKEEIYLDSIWNDVADAENEIMA